MNGSAQMYVNLGCGKRYDSGWVNIDIDSSDRDVINHDLSKGFPLDDESCDVVYSSAVLEHIRSKDVSTFLSECFRVLKPEGIIRIGVPDLEPLCRLYLSTLDAACAGDPQARADHEWLMLELYDQCVREQSGGLMAAYLSQDDISNKAFVLRRIGEEGREFVEHRRCSSNRTIAKSNLTNRLALSLMWRLRRLKQRIRCLYYRVVVGPCGCEIVDIGRFRLSGEVHQWAYDRYSLSRVLLTAGFQSPVVQPAATSQIADWALYHLDTLPDGTVIKPDLIFVEALKPRSNTE